MPRPPQPFKPRVCVICGITFTPHSTRAKTCSHACSAEYHRNFCLEKAREAAFLRPYDIDAYLARHPELKNKGIPHADPDADKPIKTKQKPEPRTRAKPQTRPLPQTQPATKRNPEPRSAKQREEQRASVISTMSIPPSQRYQFSRLWSDFQRSVAIAIEQQRLDPAL